MGGQSLKGIAHALVGLVEQCSMRLGQLARRDTPHDQEDNQRSDAGNDESGK
jgi:hypothetical protein